MINADVAQLVERNLAKVEVAGSNLVIRSKLKRRCCNGVAFFVFPMVFFAWRKPFYLEIIRLGPQGVKKVFCSAR
jgi:hypothetical protein